MDKSYNTYEKQVEQYLRLGKGITQVEAANMFGCTRLSAIIYNLIHDRGMNIISLWEHGLNRNGHHSKWVRYYDADSISE